MPYLERVRFTSPNQRERSLPVEEGPGHAATRKRPYRAVLATALLAAACSSAAEPEEAAGPATADRLTIAVPEDVGPLNILNQSDDPLTPHIETVEVLGPHEVKLTCGFNCPFLGSVTLATCR